MWLLLDWAGAGARGLHACLYPHPVSWPTRLCRHLSLLLCSRGPCGGSLLWTSWGFLPAWCPYSSGTAAMRPVLRRGGSCREGRGCVAFWVPALEATEYHFHCEPVRSLSGFKGRQQRPCLSLRAMSKHLGLCLNSATMRKHGSGGSGPPKQPP